MNSPLQISFGSSTSPKYDQAVSLASSLPGYHCQGEGRNGNHHITLELSRIDDAVWQKLERLLHLIAAWRSVSIQVEGRPINRWKLRASVARIKRCYDRKPQHASGAYYCSGKNTPTSEATGFGCRLCTAVSRQQHVSYRCPSWIEFGTLSPQRDAFQVDKQAIYQVLEQQARQEAWALCPAFSWERLRADVDELPDNITLDEDSPFELRYAELNPGKALGIKPKVTSGGSLFIRLHSSLASEQAAAKKRSVPNVRYADIAGQDQALAALRQIVQLPLTHADYFAALRVEPQAGILLYGPPGNGKTLLAKAVATESQAHLEIISGPEILSKWVGESEAHLRQIFARCRQWAPSVLLIDEIDCLAPRREGMSQQYNVQLIAQLLVLLDGLEARGRVAVVAATNRLEALDPAICRPGRFDYHIEVPLPDRTGREAILRVHLRKLRLAKQVRIHRLVKETEGYSGADLAGLCREAAMQAILRGLAAGIPAADMMVAQDDVQAAFEAWRSKRTRGVVTVE